MELCAKIMSESKLKHVLYQNAKVNRAMNQLPRAKKGESTEMKKWFKTVMGLFTALMVFQSMTVMAAEGTKVSMDVQEYSESDKTLAVSCMIENGENVTNGKIRIFYDPEKVNLQPSQAGEALSGALLEINDCLTGNKPEGEMIAVFASSQSIAAKGSLVDLKFKLQDGVKKGDEMLFRVEIDKLSGDNGEIDAEALELTYVVGDEEKPKDENDGESEDEDKKTPGGDSQNGNGNPGGSGSQSGSGSQGGSQSGNGSQSGSGNQSGSGYNNSSKSGVKTGDSTPVARYLMLGGGSCLVILGFGIALMKKRKKSEKRS